MPNTDFSSLVIGSEFDGYLGKNPELVLGWRDEILRLRRMSIDTKYHALDYTLKPVP